MLLTGQTVVTPDTRVKGGWKPSSSRLSRTELPIPALLHPPRKRAPSHADSTVITSYLERSFSRNGSQRERTWANLIVGVKLLVLPLALPQSLPLGLQRLGQVRVLQALLGVLLRQHLKLTVDGLKLLPRVQHSTTVSDRLKGLLMFHLLQKEPPARRYAQTHSYCLCSSSMSELMPLSWERWVFSSSSRWAFFMASIAVGQQEVERPHQSALHTANATATSYEVATG